MAQIIWDIAQLERHVSDGFVYTAHWTASLEEDGESVSAYGSANFGDPDPEAFIPFERLTKSEVLNWVFNSIGADQIVKLEEALGNQLKQKLNPKEESGLPW